MSHYHLQLVRFGFRFNSPPPFLANDDDDIPTMRYKLKMNEIWQLICRSSTTQQDLFLESSRTVEVDEDQAGPPF